VCGTEQFWDPDAGERVCAAPDCRAPIPRPVRLLAKHVTVLEPGLLLTSGDLTQAVESVERPIADVVRHPATGALALRNRSDAPWRVRRDSGDSEVPPRAAVLIKPTTVLTIDRIDYRFEM
jgi:hypothetical protein